MPVRPISARPIPVRPISAALAFAVACALASPSHAAIELHPGRAPLSAPASPGPGFADLPASLSAAALTLDADLAIDETLRLLAREDLPAGPHLTGAASPLQHWLGGIAGFIWGAEARNGAPLAAPVRFAEAYPAGTSLAADMFDKQASWGQMILGFAFIGTLRRRRPPSRLA
jgi:hypothetical protein